MADTSSHTGSLAGARTTAIEMPRLSSEEGTATLATWLVAEGDLVEKGTLVAELETDKATVELESPAPGRIEALVVRAGTEGLKPGMLLARIAPSTGAPETAKTRSAASLPASAPVVSPALEVSPSFPIPGRSPATPLARRVAESEGLILEGLKGTGLGGRIEKADVERLAREALAPRATSPALDATEAGSEAHSDASSNEQTKDERTVAKSIRMPSDPSSASRSAAASQPAASAQALISRARGAASSLDMPRPAVQLELRCEMDAVVGARARLNGNRSGGSAGEGALTLNDFVLRAAALALRDVPEANLRRAGDGVHPAEGIDLALVVATDAGPRVIVLRDADRKGLAVLSGEIRGRIEQVRAPEPPAPDDPTASLIVTSFGRFGVESAHPMVPPEQVAVLAVGAVVEQ
ncbi:2-oxo acid dehydrogenase subunit E2, partial [Myxococcota bacterium]|nr:2-oxo acid dehydrogenase subunit E2 [Myxococcota bacterium]